MKRKILSMLLCIAVCMTMMPAMGYAAESYGWTVAGVRVTSDNAGDITGEGITVKEGGKVSYDAGSNTLTLNNATIKTTDGAGIKCGGSTPIIELQGENVIEVSGNGISIFDSTVSNLTIKSKDGGSLKVKGTLGINCGGFSNSVALTLSNVEVEATGTNGHGIYTKGNITLENAVVKATGTFTNGTQNGNYCGIKSDGTLTLTKSSITAKKGTDGSSAIRAAKGIIAEDAELTDAYSEAIFTSGTTTILNADDKDRYVTLRNNFDEYPLWVGGVQVTSKNAANITGTGISTTDGGKVSYDVNTNTLTLNNATITGSHSRTESDITAAVMSLVKENDTFKELNINLIGKNMITNPATSTSAETADYGILSYGNIRITKDSSAKDTPSMNCTSNGTAIHSGDKTIIENTDVTATSRQSDGIFANNKIEVKYSNVTATGGAGAYAIRSRIEPEYSSDIVIEEGKAATVGTEGNTSHVIQATSDGGTVKIRKTDYTLYYNAADGNLYKSYHADAAEPKFANEYIGKGATWSSSPSTESSSSKYDTLTLHSGFAFLTTAPVALKIIGMDANETFTIKGDNGGSKVNIVAGVNNKNTDNAIGIETNASLTIEDIGLNFGNGKSRATNTITAGGSIQVINGQVLAGKVQTGGMLKLENAFLTTENSGVVTKDGIEYCGMLKLSGYSKADATTIGDSDAIAAMKGNITLNNLFNVIFASMEGTWGDEEQIDGTLENAGEYISKTSDWNKPRKISKPKAPSREGYIFTGWYCTDTSRTSTGGTKKISDGDWVTYEEAFSTVSPKKLTSEAAEEIVNRDLSLWLRADWKKDGTSHTHNWSTDWTSDGNCHWHECAAEGCNITDNSQKEGYAAHNDDCTSSEDCSTCGYKSPEARSSHNYPDTWAAVRPGSTHTKECQNPGCRIAQTGSCVSDGKVTCQEFAKCTVCGGDCGTKADHSFTAEIVGKDYLKSPATCKAKAVYYKSCSVCGLSSKDWVGEATFESGEPTNHNFGDWKITKQPTATEKGSKERVCSECQYKETAEIPATSGGSTSGGGSGSGGGSTVAPVQKPEIQPVNGGKTSLSKDGSTLEITPDEGMEIGTVTVNGKEVTVKDGKITGLKTGDKVQVAFKSKAPTKEEQDQKAVKTVKNLKLTVRTTRTSERNVRTYVKADRKLNAATAELKADGYTVKYKFYRSAKKASDYQLMLTKNAKNYVNTMGSKDTCYYYKVRLAVYDADGGFLTQTDLAQCRYGSRVWK